MLLSSEACARDLHLVLETDNKETAGNGEDMLLRTKAWHQWVRF
jgi:hypothetical protein